MRFFSYLEAAAYYDEDRTAWTALTHWLSKTIHGDESVSTQVKEQVAQSLYDAAGGERGEDAVSARARLQDIRKRVGNSMQLAPLLMTRENQVNDRIALLASKQLWKEHAAASRAKLGPAANLERAQSLAQGAGSDLIRRTWWDSFSSAEELARLGIFSLQGSPSAGSAAAAALGPGQSVRGRASPGCLPCLSWNHDQHCLFAPAWISFGVCLTWISCGTCLTWGHRFTSFGLICVAL